MSRKKYPLTKSSCRDMKNSQDRWMPCPECGKKRFYHLLPGAAGRNIAVWCRQCRREIVIHIPANGGRQDPE